MTRRRTIGPRCMNADDFRVGVLSGSSTRSPGSNPRWARSPWITNCSTPRSRRWRVNALWPTGGRDDEQDTLALLGSLLRYDARRAGVEDLACQRLSLSHAAEH